MNTLEITENMYGKTKVEIALLLISTNAVICFL
jgi:hypothetical protein